MKVFVWDEVGLTWNEFDIDIEIGHPMKTARLATTLVAEKLNQNQSNIKHAELIGENVIALGVFGGDIEPFQDNVPYVDALNEITRLKNREKIDIYIIGPSAEIEMHKIKVVTDEMSVYDYPSDNPALIIMDLANHREIQGWKEWKTAADPTTVESNRKEQSDRKALFDLLKKIKPKKK